MKKALILTLWFFAGVANATVIEHITNGDFEAGNFSGWNVVNSGSGSWNINDGSFVTPFGPIAPIGGSFDAVTTQSGPGFHGLYQDVTLSSTFDSAILSWDDRVQSFADFSDPNQEWRVIIEDIAGNLISEVFSTNPGDANPQIGPNSRSFDLTALLNPFANQTIRIGFEQEDNLSNFSATLDNVSFSTSSSSSVPEPSSLAIFGLGLVGLGIVRRNKKA